MIVWWISTEIKFYFLMNLENKIENVTVSTFATVSKINGDKRQYVIPVQHLPFQQNTSEMLKPGKFK